LSNVRLLDSSTISKIAAGEVVERPASCVKELVENSIDAGAKRIEIEIQSGGKGLMRVTDDGAGMSKEDCTLAIKRHATSKLSSVKDLMSLSTLGFRGEALPTIASVSKFILQTRRKEDELGTKIKIDGGKILDTHDVGCKVGTTVLVEDLFFNTPARLKFLKSTPTEANKIHDFIVKLALSRPEISFKFINGTRTALTTPGNGKIFDTLTSIYGAELTETLIETNFLLGDVKIFGYVGKPNFLKSYRTWQTFVVNGRVVANRTISKAVEEAYKSLIPRGSYPLAVFKIDVPQNSIDVNVHPQKIEIKFEDEGKIFKAIYRAVHDAISEPQQNLNKIAAAPEKFHYEKIFSPQTDLMINQQENKNFFSVEEVSEKIQPQNNFLDDFEEKIPAPVEEKFFENPPQTEEKFFEKLQPIGQVALCYIIAQNNSDLYIIDQHAAHERILFDKLCAYSGKIPAQQLLIHKILHFDSRESEIVEKNLEIFAQLGFSMEMSGPNEFRLIEIPADASDADAEDMMREIISTVAENFSAKDISKNIRQSVLAITACRAAIKAGQELNHAQMQILLENLSKTPNPHTCPHGRPTIIKFSAKDLAKMFKRT